MLITGPRWNDNDSADLKFRFIFHTALVFRRMNKIMSKNPQVQKVLEPTGFSKFLSTMRRRKRPNPVSEVQPPNDYPAPPAFLDDHGPKRLTLKELLSDPVDLEFFKQELQSSETLDSSDLDDMLSEYPEWMTDVEYFLSNMSAPFKGKTYNHLQTILGALALSPVMDAWGKVYKDAETDKGFAMMFSKGLESIKNATDVTEGVMQALLYFTRFFYNLNRLNWNFTKVFNWMEKARDDAWWFRAVKLHNQLKTGSYKQDGVTLPDIWAAFNLAERRLLADTHLYKGVVQRRIFTQQVTQVMQWKEDWKNVSQEGASKAQPFGVTLFGPPGIGKTVAIEFIDRWLHELCGIKQRNTVSVNDADAFDSGLDNSTTAIKWDDIGNLLHNKRPEPLQTRLLRYVNAEVTNFTGASIEEKGTKFNHAQLFFATTNSPTLQSQYESTEPESAWRRLGVKLECSVHPDYALKVEKRKGPRSTIPASKFAPAAPDDAIQDRVILDKEKLDPNHQGFPAHMRYRAYEMDANYKVKYITDYMEHVEAMHYVRDACLLHFKYERARMIASQTAGNTKYCVHKMIPTTCRECAKCARQESEFLTTIVARGLDRTQAWVLHTLNDWCAEGLANPIFEWSRHMGVLSSSVNMFHWFFGVLMSVALLVTQVPTVTECHKRFFFFNECNTYNVYEPSKVCILGVVTLFLVFLLKMFCYFLSLPHRALEVLETRTLREVDAAMAARPPTGRESRFLHWICGAGVLGFVGLIIHQCCLSAKINIKTRRVEELTQRLQRVGLSQSERREISRAIDDEVCDTLKVFEAVRVDPNYVSQVTMEPKLSIVRKEPSPYELMFCCTYGGRFEAEEWMTITRGIQTFVNRSEWEEKVKQSYKTYYDMTPQPLDFVNWYQAHNLGDVPKNARGKLDFQPYWQKLVDINVTTSEHLATSDEPILIPSLAEKKVIAKMQTPGEFHSWKKAPIGGGQATGRSKTMTTEQAKNVFKNNLVSITYYPSDSPSHTLNCLGLFLQTNVLLIPNHLTLLPNGADDEKGRLVITSYVGEHEIKHTGYISAAAKVPNTDLRLVLFNCGKLVKNISSMLPVHTAVSGSAIVGEFIGRSNSSPHEFEEAKVVATRGSVWSSQGGQFDSWCYELPFATRKGLCMSILLREHLGVTIEGFHLSGSGETKIGHAGILTRDLFDHCLSVLKQSPMYVAPTEPAPLVVDNPVTKSKKRVNEVLHPHSVGNFLPPSMFFTAIADIDRGSRGSKTTMEANPHIQAALDNFGIEKKYGVPKMDMNKNFRNSVILGTSTVSRSPPPELLERAFEDYIKVIPDAVAKTKQQPWCTNRPLTYDEIITGIDEHPYCHSIKVDKSAGYPFGVTKKRVMTYNDAIERHEFLPEVQQMILDTETQILAGGQSGIPFNATLKSESRLLEKCDKARVFFADSVVRYILVQKWLGPAMFVINQHPEKFETSIGLDRLSSRWQEHMQKLLDNPDRCMATDFSTYDHSQHLSVRAAVVSVFVKICEHLGYSKQEQECVRYVANEFLFPILNFGGYVAQGETIQPSGTNLTAHTNGIAGALLMRASFFKHLGNDLDFREHVHVRDLGDDVISALEESVDLDVWNTIVYAQDCDEWGLVATPPQKDSKLQPFANVYEEAYLKSKFWYSDDLKCTIGLLDPISIFKPLEWFERSKEASFEEQHLDTLRAIVRECFFYGREAHDWAICAVRAYAREISLPLGGAFVDLTYDEKVSQFLEGPNYRAQNRPPNSPIEHPYPKFWCEVLRSEADISEGLTEFKTETEAQAPQPPPTMLPMIVSDADAQFAQFFERPVKVGTFKLALDAELIQRFDPFEAVFSDPNIMEKLQTWAVGKASVEITFVASKTTGHACLLQISTIPLPGQNLFYTDTDVSPSIRLLNASQRDCLYWDLSTDGGAKFVCNYMWQYSGSWLFAQEFSEMHSLSVEVVGSLLHVSNNDQPVIVTVYARLTDFTFSGSTAVRNEAESYSSVLSSLADVASLSSKYLSFAPGLAMATDFASMALEGASGVARLFGHSRPVEEGNYESVYTSPPLATMNSNLNGRMLALDRSQGLSMSGAISGSTAPDEMLFAFLLGKKNLVGVFRWDSTQPQGKRLFNLNNTCCAGVYGYGMNQVAATTQAIVTANFTAAHWTNHYRITIVTPKDNGGTLQLVYEPTGHVRNYSTMTNRSVVFDIAEERSLEFSCEWQQPSTLRQVHPGYFLDPFGEYLEDNMNGAFSLFVENPLSPFSDVTQAAWIVVESWMEPNLVLGNYAPMDLTSYALVGEPATSVQTRSLLPVQKDTPYNVVRRGTGFFQPKRITVASSPHVPPTSAPVLRSIPPSSRPATGAPTRLTGDTSAPTQLPVYTGTSAPSGPTRPPTNSPSTAPTYVPCSAHLISVPLKLVSSSATGSGTLVPPYYSGSDVKVPTGVSPIGIPYFSDGSGAVSLTVTNANGVTLTDGSQVVSVVTDAAFVVNFTYSGAAGYHQTHIVITGGDFQVTALQATCAAGYSWTEFGPTSWEESTPLPDSTTVPTISLPHSREFGVPGFPSSDLFCYPNTTSRSTGGVPLVIFGGSGSVRLSGVLWCATTYPGLISRLIDPNSLLEISSGYDTPVMEFHSVLMPIPATSETTFGSPFIGRELIAPIHFGEQVMSIRSLWKVFKQQQYLVLDPSTLASNLVGLSSRGGVLEGAIQNTLYGFRTPNANNLNLLTLDSMIFLSYSSVRGGMVSHYTVEFGDGLLKFVRPHEDLGTDLLNTRRGFEQMHTAVQRSIVINWPCYMEQRFLVPRSVGYTNELGPGLYKQVIMSVANNGPAMIVREDVAIGEDFSLSYFIGTPALTWVSNRGYSIAPPHFQQNSQLMGAGTFAPSTAPATPVPTNTVAPNNTFVPTVTQTFAPTTQNQSALYNGPALAPSRRLEKKEKGFLNSLLGV